MPVSKELKNLIKAAQSWNGWRVAETKNGWMIYPPDKNLPGILVHATESDHRAMRNTIARLRRAGAPI